MSSLPLAPLTNAIGVAAAHATSNATAADPPLGTVTARGLAPVRLQFPATPPSCTLCCRLPVSWQVTAKLSLAVSEGGTRTSRVYPPSTVQFLATPPSVTT